MKREEMLLRAAEKALECLEEILEDTDGDDGERIVNPLLVALKTAIVKYKR